MGQTQRLGKTATTVRRLGTKDGDKLIVRYHQTDVVVFSAESITLDSGGWRTSTTKNRMNQASNQFGLGYCVFQKGFCWYVDLPSGETVDFVDGMVFDR